MALPTYTIVEYSLLTPPPPSFSFNISAPQSQLSLPSAPTALANANNIFISGIVDVNQVRAVDTFQNRGTTGFEQLNGAPADLLTLNTTSSIGTIKAAPQDNIGWIPATVAEATQLFTWQKLVQLAVSDTVANLLTFNTTRTVTGPIEATTNATVNQAYQLLAWSKPVLFNIEDTVANVLTFNTTKTVLGDIIATGGANVSATQQFATWGKTPLFDTVDTVANIVAALPASLSAFNKAQAVEATGVATVAQANSIYTIEPQGDGVNVAIQEVAGTAAELASLQFGTNDYAQTLTASNAANVAQATTIQGFFTTGNAGVTVYSITDLASVVATATPEVLGTAQNIIANGPAIDAAEAQVILGALNNGTTLISAVTDNAANIVDLNFDANDTIISVVVSGTAGVGQADVIQGYIAAGFVDFASYSISDTITLLNGASNATLNGAVDITGTGIGTVAEANRVMAATNSGQTSLAQVSGTSAAVATLAVGANDTILAITTTNTATATQASAIGAIALAAGTTNLQINNITDGFQAVQNLINSAGGQEALASAQTATVANGTQAADIIQFGAFTASLLPNGLAISSLGGNDSITGSEGADTVTGGTGADVIGLLTGGVDRIVQGGTDSVVATGYSVAPGTALASTQILTFGNGLDIVDGFTAGAGPGADVLAINVAGRPNLALGLVSNAVIAANTSWYLSGNYNSASGQFTITNNGVGADTIIVQGNGSATFLTAQSYTLLRGVNSGALTANNFDGALPAAFSASMNAPAAATTLTLTGATSGAVTVATTTTAGAAGVAVTQGGAAVTVGNAAGYTAAGLTTIDASTVNSGFLTTFTLSGSTGGVAGVNPALTTVRGANSGDRFNLLTDVLYNPAGGGTSGTIWGGAGTDTIAWSQALVGNVTVGAVGAGNANTTIIADAVEELVLTAGTGGNTLTVGALTDVTVRNTGASSQANVTLGSQATQSYVSASTGNDVVTLGASGQQVTLSGGGSDNVLSSAAAAAGSSFTGSAVTTDRFSLTDNALTLLNIGRTANSNTLALNGVETLVLVAGTGANNINLNADVAMTVDASLVGANAVTLAGSGSAIAVTQSNGASALTLSGSANFTVGGGGNGSTGTITSTGTGTLVINAANHNGTQAVVSSSATTLNLAGFAGGGDIQTISGTGNYTVTGLGAAAGSAGTLSVLAGATGTTAVTLGANASTLQTAAGAGAITVDATALGAQLTIGNSGAGSTGAFTVNNLIATGGNVVFATTTNTAAATINGTDAAAHTVTTGAGADVITFTNATGDFAITVQSNAGNDIINLSATTGANAITGGAGTDLLTGGAAVDNFIYQTQATSVSAANLDRITNFVSGVDKINLQVSALTAGTSTLGFTSAVGMAGAAALGNQTNATNVATFGDVQAALTTQLSTMAASTSVATTGLFQNIVVTFTNGAAAGDYLVINDNTVGYQANNDFVVNITGIAGGAGSWAGTDIAVTNVA